MATANAITGNTGNLTYFANGSETLTVGLSGHGIDHVNYANVVKFNDEDDATIQELYNAGGRKQALHLLLVELGINPKFNSKLKLLEMADTTTSKRGVKVKTVRFYGAKILFEGVEVFAVSGRGLAFYMYKDNTFRSASALRRFIKK